MRLRMLLLAPALLLPSAAHAVVPVEDLPSEFQQAQSYLQDLKAWVVQNSQWLHEANTDLQTAQIYAQELQTYLALVNEPPLQAVMGLVNRAGLGNDLPVNPSSMMGIAGGFNSLSNQNGAMSLNQAFGALGNLSRLTSVSYGQNHVYTCAATDPACIDINARSNGIAGSMGTTQAQYASMKAHEGSMQAWRDEMVGVTDPAKRETIMAQLQIEQVWTANNTAQLQASVDQAALQQQSFQQRTIERQRQSADELLADSQPMAGP